MPGGKFHFSLTVLGALPRPRIGLKSLGYVRQKPGTTLIFARFSKAFSRTRRRNAAVQFALFAMLVQAMIPLSAAIALPGADAQARQGQSLPGFYLVICTAYGAQTSVNGDQPLDGGGSAMMPWDCPVCQVQASVQGPVPQTPQVASTPYPLPLGCRAPAESDRVAGLWSAAPGLARGPPSALTNPFL